MSEEQESQATETAPTPQGPSWLRILAGYWLAAAILVTAGILLIQFLDRRPDDLVAYTGHLVNDVLEQTLRANNVPPDRIFRSNPSMRQDERTRWMDFTLDVLLPERISADGLRELVREAMLERDVKLEVVTNAPEGQSWRLKLGRLDFATVRVRDRSRAAQTITDLSAACNRITNEVEEVLLEAGVREESFSREVPVVQMDEETRWTITHLGALLPEGLTPGELRGRIEDSMSHRDVRVRTEDMGMNVIALHVAYAGKDCTTVLCRTPLTAFTVETAPEETSAPEVITEPPLPEASPPRPAGGTVSLEPLEPSTVGDESAGIPEATPAPEKEAPTPPGPREKRGRVAIILDDGGNDWAVAEKVLALDSGLTLAVLPNTPFLTQTVEAAVARGFELMLHMPMETDSKTVDPGPGKITTAMDKAEIQRLTREALAQVPGVKGVNNHTGSAFTADREHTGYFLEVLKEKGLFFIDSRTTNDTVAYDVASEMGVAVNMRDVFLDDTNDTESSKTRLKELADLALARGSAVGIGHFREETAALLAQELPKLADKGVTLVHVSELVR